MKKEAYFIFFSLKVFVVLPYHIHEKKPSNNSNKLHTFYKSNSFIFRNIL